MAPTTIESMQSQRTDLLEAVAALPPFRRGTVSRHARTCGKANCRCQRSPAHRHTEYQWTATIHGKKYHKTIHLGPEVAKYLDETTSYRRFLALMEQFVSINEQLSDQIIPVDPSTEEELDLLKKKLQKRLSKPRRKKSAG